MAVGARSKLGLAVAIICAAVTPAYAQDACTNPRVSGGKIEDRIIKRSDWMGSRTFDMALLKPQPLNSDGKPDIKGIGIHNTGVPFVLREGPQRSGGPPWNGCTKLAGHHDGHYNPNSRGVRLGGAAYHFYIDTTGAVFEGREVKYVGATYTKYDPTGLITVVLEGSFSTSKLPEYGIKKTSIEDYESRGLIKRGSAKRSGEGWVAAYTANTPTDKQIATLKELLVWLSDTYAIDPMSTEVGHGIHGHDEFPAVGSSSRVDTSCPGENLSSRLTELRKSTKDGLEALRAR